MQITEIPKLFGVTDVNDINSVDQGHINDTYIVTASDKKYILQSLNKNVFKAPDVVMKNISAVERIFAKYTPDDVTIPHFLRADDGRNFVTINDTVWRMYDYTEGETSADDPYSCGFAIGTFDRIMNRGKLGLQQAIPDFHNYDVYFEKYSEICTDNERKEAFSLMKYDLNRILRDMPKRTIHGDTKYSDIVIGDLSVVIDLDTVMQGYVAYDFGDLVRSVCTEEDYFTALYDVACGYADGIENTLTNVEIDSLYYGMLWCTAELSMRYTLGSLRKENSFLGIPAAKCRERADQIYNQFKAFRDDKIRIVDIIQEAFGK